MIKNSTTHLISVLAFVLMLAWAGSLSVWPQKPSASDSLVKIVAKEKIALIGQKLKEGGWCRRSLDHQLLYKPLPDYQTGGMLFFDKRILESRLRLVYTSQPVDSLHAEVKITITAERRWKKSKDTFSENPYFPADSLKKHLQQAVELLEGNP